MEDRARAIKTLNEFTKAKHEPVVRRLTDDSAKTYFKSIQDALQILSLPHLESVWHVLDAQAQKIKLYREVYKEARPYTLPVLQANWQSACNELKKALGACIKKEMTAQSEYANRWATVNEQGQDSVLQRREAYQEKHKLLIIDDELERLIHRLEAIPDLQTDNTLKAVKGSLENQRDKVKVNLNLVKGESITEQARGELKTFSEEYARVRDRNFSEVLQLENRQMVLATTQLRSQAEEERNFLTNEIERLTQKVADLQNQLSRQSKGKDRVSPDDIEEAGPATEHDTPIDPPFDENAALTTALKNAAYKIDTAANHKDFDGKVKVVNNGAIYIKIAKSAVKKMLSSVSKQEATVIKTTAAEIHYHEPLNVGDTVKVKNGIVQSVTRNITPAHPPAPAASQLKGHTPR